MTISKQISDNFTDSSQISICRSVRVGVPFPGQKDHLAETGPGEKSGLNGWAGMPPSDGFSAHHELTVECRGVPDPVTGYLIGIQHLDAAVRTHIRPLLFAWCEGTQPTSAAAAVHAMAAAIQPSLPANAQLHSLTWAPSPFIKHTWRSTMPQSALFTEQFEFSAAHRLHCPQLSEEENRQIFGKCNHASGHGHNYQIAVAVRVTTGEGKPSITTGSLERIVKARVIDRFDHRHLNVDCEEFLTLNPSVENISRVCFNLLQQPVADAGAVLDHVTVWETAKTWATYPAVNY